MKITMIGAGAMGGATVEGLLKAKSFKQEEITVADPTAEVLEKFKAMGPLPDGRRRELRVCETFDRCQPPRWYQSKHTSKRPTPGGYCSRSNAGTGA